MIEDKLCQLIDQFNEIKLIIGILRALLDNIHTFNGGNGRTCNILFVSNSN